MAPVPRIQRSDARSGPPLWPHARWRTAMSTAGPQLCNHEAVKSLPAGPLASYRPTSVSAPFQAPPAVHPLKASGALPRGSRPARVRPLGFHADPPRRNVRQARVCGARGGAPSDGRSRHSHRGRGAAVRREGHNGAIVTARRTADAAGHWQGRVLSPAAHALGQAGRVGRVQHDFRHVVRRAVRVTHEAAVQRDLYGTRHARTRGRARGAA